MKVFLLFLIAFVFSITAIADEYSDALDAEASGATVDYKSNNENVKTKTKSKNDWSFSGQSLEKGMPANLPHKKFEKALKNLYYGTYAFYLKLTVGQANDVYDAYLEGTDIEKLRNVIMVNYRKNL